MPKKLEIKSGDIINGWEIVKEVERTQPKHRRFLIRCSVCKKELEKNLTDIRACKTGMCISCKNGVQWTKHGYANDPLYYVLKDMHRRCSCPNGKDFEIYGSRGIKVCSEWADTSEGIVNFINWANENGYQKGLVIDRIDNDKGYNPDNCRWTTYTMNNFNVRRTKGYRPYRGKYEVYITYQGKMRTKTVKTEEEAITLRKQWELELYGENSPNYR